MAQWGIRVIIAQPGGLKTEFASHSIRFSAASTEYEGLLGEMRRSIGTQLRPDLGDPKVAAAVIAKAVAADHPPLRLPLGADAVAMAKDARRKRDHDLVEWEEIGSTVTPGQVPMASFSA